MSGNLTLNLYQGYTSVSDPREKGSSKKGGGIRGVITGFSKQSRLRLMKMLRSLNDSPDFMITLTYPKHYPADADEWKRHLDNFRRRVSETFPGFWAMWKLEPQKRGAPHFHLMGSFGKEAENMGKSDLYKLLRVIWYRIVGSGDGNHFLKGVQVEDLRGAGHKKQSIYVSKYVGKTQELEKLPGWARPGRFWGIHNRGNMPPYAWESVNLKLSHAVWLKRLVKRWLRRETRQYSRRLSYQNSYSVFCPPELMRKILYWILGPYQLESWKSDRDFGDVCFYDPVNGLQLDFSPF